MMADTKGPQTCNWCDGRACLFEGIRDEIIEHDGRHYCLLHRPLETHSPETIERAVKNIRQLGVDKHNIFDGVTFPAAKYQIPGDMLLSFVCCTFAHECSFDIQNGAKHSIRLNDSEMRGRMKLKMAALRTLECRSCRIAGPFGVTIEGKGVPFQNAEFDGTYFGGPLILGYSNVPLRLSLMGCTFDAAPDLTAIEEIPQRTFWRSTFTAKACNAEDAGRYRKIRNLFNKNRARDEEGTFYALEKRCHRKSLSWWPLRNLFARTFSKLYDVFSEYGQSYERAIAWFAALQLTAGLAYGLALHRISVCVSLRPHLCGDFDASLVRFTLAQVVRPFEMFASRSSGGWTDDLIGHAPSGLWLAATTLHSILSLLLLALVFLAVRWRFRRE